MSGINQSINKQAVVTPQDTPGVYLQLWAGHSGGRSPTHFRERGGRGGGSERELVQMDVHRVCLVLVHVLVHVNEQRGSCIISDGASQPCDA